MTGRPRHNPKSNRSRERTQDILFGINPITEAIKAGRRKIFQIIHKEGLQGSPAASLISLARTKGIPVTVAPMEKVAALAGADGSQGLVAMVSPPVYSSFDKLLDQLAAMNSPIVAALDGVMDPRNLGAIIRSAEAFGLAAVIYPERRAAGYTPVAAKASAGAGEHMRLCPVVNVAEALRILRKEGFSCVALEGGAAEELGQPPAGPVAIALGGEGTGLRPLVTKRCARVARIPMSGRVGSLNVSAAAAIAFHWAASGRG